MTAAAGILAASQAGALGLAVVGVGIIAAIGAWHKNFDVGSQRWCKKTPLECGSRTICSYCKPTRW